MTRANGSRGVPAPVALVVRVGALIRLAAWATREIVRASLMVARDIVAPSDRVVPGIVIVPIPGRTAVETALISSLIILTPGTIVVSVRRDLGELWVHGMYAADPEELRAQLLALEARVVRTMTAGRAS